MVKSAIRMLLAASALLPGLATAQQEAQGDRHHGDRAPHDQPRPSHPSGPAQGQSSRPQGQLPPPQAGAPFRQGQSQPLRPATPPGQYQRPDVSPGARGGPGGYAGRGDRPDRGPNGSGPRGGDAGRGAADHPRWGPNAPGGQEGYAGRGAPDRQHWAQDADGGQGGHAGRGDQGHPGDRPGLPDRGRPDHPSVPQRGAPPTAYGWHVGEETRGGYRGQPDRGGWNNHWHADQRYDWNRYREENREAFRLPRYYAPSGRGYGYRRFAVGLTLGYGFYGENYWIDDPYDYRLPPAYGPYRWVRYYNDALLVDVRTGYVVDAVYDIFW